MDTDKRDFIIYLIIFLVVSGLCAGIHIKYTKLSCDKCKISFISELPVTRDRIEIKVHPEELSSALKNDSCPIIWTKNGGFQYARSLE